MNTIARAALVAALAFPVVSIAQQPDAPARQAGDLSAQQTLEFAQARQDFAAGKWEEALTTLQTLHAKHPRNAEVAKFAAEAALNTGDLPYAETTLTQLLAAANDDWQARVLMARTYAQQHKDAERDAALAELVKMHANTPDGRFKQLTQFMVERINLADSGHIELFYSLQPWSRYNIYETASYFEPSGKRNGRVTLESNDTDQPSWAQQHPKEAAAGERMFSMDSYGESIPGPNGTSTQTHGTIRFFDGRPSYNAVREIMIGKRTVMSSMTTTTKP